MKKITAFLLCAAIFVLGISACGSDSDGGKTFNDYMDFEGEIIGVVHGNLATAIIQDVIGGTAGVYPGVEASLADIRSGEIAGFITDLSIVNVLAASHEDMKVIPVPAEIFSGSLGAFSADQELINEFNTFLAELKADGTLADMQKRWLEDIPDENTNVPEFNLSGENGTLNVLTTIESKPFSYSDNDATHGFRPAKGYSIELAVRFAAGMGMDIKFYYANFSDLIDYVANGDGDLKFDFGIDAVTITEERAQKVIFSDSIYDDLLGIITLK